MYSIDTHAYDKANTYPIDHGYDVRAHAPTAIVVHSTEGGREQSLPSAASYLYASANVSSHYLIGRTGEIIQFLEPLRYSAWHAGTAEAPFVNQRSIGIECLHSQGELWPAVQKDALAWLLQSLIAQYSIPARLIETHGQIAIPGPYQRKVDPTNWPHDQFIVWRDALYAPAPAVTIVHAGPYGAIARQDYQAAGKAAAYYGPGNRIEIDGFHQNGYRHAASGIGFIADGDLVFS